MEAERRPVTILFADMAGFTAFTERAGEEAAYALMGIVHCLTSRAVQAHGGTVKEVAGDSIVGVFGVPVALEDGPLRACRAALSIQQRLAEQAGELAASSGITPRLRIGLNTGTVLVSSSGDGAGLAIFGDPMNTAARLQALAPPGTVLLSEAVYKLVQGLVDGTFVGLHHLKGKTAPQPAWRLDAIRERTPRFRTALVRGLSTYVGRERELQRLDSILRDSERGLKVADIVGEAGIGKSRLLHEFCARSAPEGSVLSGSCSPDGREMPFLPLIEILCGCFGIAAGEGQVSITRKLSDGLAAFEQFSRHNLGLLLNLMGLEVPTGALRGLDGVLIGLRTRDLLQQLLQIRQRASPLVILLEDLQWIDTASEEILTRIVRARDDSRLTIVHTRRPEYQPPWLDEAATTLRLAPLSDAETCRIAQERFGAVDLPDALARLVAERAGGNPLFAEEIASFLLERRVVRRAGEGFEYDNEAVASALPSSVQSLLSARIDRLEQSDRAILQAASVIGRRFDRDILAAASDDGDALRARLAALQTADLLQPGDASGEFVFKHALVRDALYGSLLTARRAALHQRIAAAIERRSGNRPIEVAELLAHHYGMTDCVEKAFEYLALAGAKSIGVYSLEEADRYFARAMEVATAFPGRVDPAKFGDLLVRYLQMLLMTSRFLQMSALAETHARTLETLSDQLPLALVLAFHATSLMMQARFGEAASLSARAVQIASTAELRLILEEGASDDRAVGYVLASAAAVLTIAAARRPGETEAMGLEAVRRSSGADDAFLPVWSLAALGWHYFCRGLLVEGRDCYRRLLEVGQAQQDPRASSFGLWMLGYLAVFEEQYEEALDCGRRGEALALTPWDRTSSLSLQGVALTLVGRVEEGLDKLTTATRMCREQGNQYTLSAQEPVFGIAMARQGRFSAGVAYIEDCVRRRDEEGDRVFADWTRLILAEVYLEFLAPREQAPLWVVLRNLPFLVHARLRGAGRALALLDRVLRNEQFSERGYICARAHLAIGLAHKIRNDVARAREHLQRARGILAAIGTVQLLERVDALLSDLERRSGVYRTFRRHLAKIGHVANE
jgi:class 3 adenylate cyclase/tetratricopeptide (TPR) repeat protein